MSDENTKEILDELEIDQHVYDDVRIVSIFLDDVGDEQIDIEFIINDDGEYQLKTLFLNKSFSPYYCFSEVGQHVRLTKVHEHCNMIPPDFQTHDPIGMTPTEPNEGFRSIGIDDFKSKYEWSREEQDWIIKEEEK